MGSHRGLNTNETVYNRIGDPPEFFPEFGSTFSCL
jgi:hypothetical protein